MSIDINQDVKGELTDRLAEFERGRLLAAHAYLAMQHALAEIERLEPLAAATVDLTNAAVSQAAEIERLRTWAAVQRLELSFAPDTWVQLARIFPVRIGGAG